MEEKYDHEIYKHCPDEKEADGIAWAFVNKEKMVRFPFKFPEVGPKELRANILYAGLCHSDVLTVRELWGKTTFPIAPGHEIIAEVSQVGSEVTDYKKGDLVGFGTMRDCCEECAHCKEGREEICTAKGEHFTYGKYWGGYATAIQQPAAFFFHLPEKFDLARGAPLFCAGITTYFPMEKYLKPGMKAGVVGIGGLGHVAVKFLKKLGHEVTAFSSSPNKVQSIKDLGVDNVIISTDDEAMKAAEGTIDFMINTLPIKDGFDKYFKTMASGGYFVQVGLPPHEDMNLSFPCALLVIKEITIVGSCVGPRPVIKKMLPLCVEKDIYPIVEEFPFEDFPKAFDKLENGRPHFRCVVNVKDYAEKNGFKK
jgi:D-arabinose 1-dehydrogenase-like Zn-dependent alcohol dehydrogenase